ncbi:Immunoglobulin I-set [Trinorchestia longiramus]|nr:Immunoglobulin I-set [Trinorchestia longiramus]
MSAPKIIQGSAKVSLLLFFFFCADIAPASCYQPASRNLRKSQYYVQVPEAHFNDHHGQKDSRRQHYSPAYVDQAANHEAAYSFTPRQNRNRQRYYGVPDAGQYAPYMGQEIPSETEAWERSSAGPSFDFSPPRNVTALKDANAYLHCIVNNLTNKTLSWIREKDLHILTVGKVTYTADNRFEVIHKDHSNSWTLKINSVQPRDTGRYECQVNSHPTDPITFEVDLAVFVPTAHIVGSTERYVDRGSTINLTCIINHNPDPASSTFWYHNNKIINYDSPGSRVSVITDRGTSTKTILLIHDASNTASGTYSCAPSPSAAASVKIHILNGETPAAMQTNSAASFECCNSRSLLSIFASFWVAAATILVPSLRCLGLYCKIGFSVNNGREKRYSKSKKLVQGDASPQIQGACTGRTQVHCGFGRELQSVPKATLSPP